MALEQAGCPGKGFWVEAVGLSEGAPKLQAGRPGSGYTHFPFSSLGRELWDSVGDILPSLWPQAPDQLLFLPGLLVPLLLGPSFRGVTKFLLSGCKGPAPRRPPGRQEPWGLHSGGSAGNKDPRSPQRLPLCPSSTSYQG